MNDYARIYATDAERYDRLVRAEDADGALARALDRRFPAPRVTVLDVGAGTGRMERILGDAVLTGLAVDRSLAMLRVAATQAPTRRWAYTLGDARALPVAGRSFDVAIAGWVLGHLREWYPATWRRELRCAIGEMCRALRPGGALIIVDTLSTGTTEPAAPTPALAEYHTWLETEAGLRRDVVRTDYAFRTEQEGRELLGFFFGADLARRALAAASHENGIIRVPECTGIWWKEAPTP